MNTSHLRYEIKFNVSIQELDVYESKLMAFSESFYKRYNDRIVNNIYFDSLENNSLIQNISGEANRAKLRLRWYGDIDKIVSPQLELKYKINKLGGKEIFYFKSNFESTFESINENFISSLDDKFQGYFKLYGTPVLLNRYERKYFESFDNSLRVTFDYNQEFYDLMKYSFLNTKYRSNTIPTNVIEVKFHEKDIKRAKSFMNYLGLRQNRFSKYVNGAINAY